MENRPFIQGHLLAFFVTTVWGTTFISTKVLLRAFQPVEIILLRFSLAWLVLFCVSPKPLFPKSWREELPFMGAGLTGLALYFLLENTALSYTLASNVGIIISAAPMFSALLLWLCRRAPRPRWSFFLGFAIAMSGIVLITVASGAKLELNPLGDLLTLGAACSWGAYGVFVELTRGRAYSNLQVTRKVFFWGLIFSAPAAFYCQADLSLSRLADPVMLANVLYLALGASATCFILWNRALSILGPVATNVYIYITPVITLAASALILHEPVTLAALASIALILLGLWLSQRRPTGLPTAEKP
jgi:drug/metabolite transporter (DMT)-like permease